MSDAMVTRLYEEEIESLESQLRQSKARANLLKKTLKMLHSDVCYQLSDEPMNFQPDRPSAKTFKIVEGVLNK